MIQRRRQQQQREWEREQAGSGKQGWVGKQGGRWAGRQLLRQLSGKWPGQGRSAAGGAEVSAAASVFPVQAARSAESVTAIAAGKMGAGAGDLLA